VKPKPPPDRHYQGDGRHAAPVLGPFPYVGVDLRVRPRETPQARLLLGFETDLLPTFERVIRHARAHGMATLAAHLELDLAAVEQSFDLERRRQAR